MARSSTLPTLFDQMKRLAISDLKRSNCLVDGCYSSGLVSWGLDGATTDNLAIVVDLTGSRQYMELNYTVNEEEYINYRVHLVKIPSNLGRGSVWFFECPQTGKRCRILYLAGTHFLHREACRGLMYKCQTQSKRWRLLQMGWDASKRKGMPRNTHYRGIRTKRFDRWLRKTERGELVVTSGLWKQLLR